MCQLGFIYFKMYFYILKIMTYKGVVFFIEVILISVRTLLVHKLT
ncbi:hypothetical protein P20495_3853 [Pseudoalteromonas sp. BSi20495]|nr:hypothetical protein P20495_3853 [Pseudoalteromonas sp. BSi20495]